MIIDPLGQRATKLEQVYAKKSVIKSTIAIIVESATKASASALKVMRTRTIVASVMSSSMSMLAM